MKSSRITRGIVIFAICALLNPFTGLAKNSVERPFKVKATGVIVMSLLDYSYQAIEHGQATHLGTLVNVYSGFFNPETMLFVSAEGVTTAANGDQTFWELGDGPQVAKFTGGTGRFEEASGDFVWVTSDLTMEIDLETLTMTLRYKYTGNGTIKY